MKTPRIPHARFIPLLLAVLFAAVACAIQGTTHKSVGAVPQNQWDASRGPVVPHDSFPRDCSLCHEGSSWHAIRKDFVFDHTQETGVALVGAHAAAECLRCHNDRGPVGEFAQRGCVGCHEDIHRGKLGVECSGCHAETNWLPDDQITRHNSTRFPLVGAHVAVACYACHAGAQVGNFDRTSIECVDCHGDQRAGATSPDHSPALFTNCERCHTPTNWSFAGYHRNYPLTGVHASIACEACHGKDVSSGAPTACAECHQRDYDGTAQPNHAAAGFSIDCARCHNTSTWDGAKFAHKAWPLSGMHAVTACNACHANSVFSGTPTTCVACHQATFDATRDPDHAASGYPTTCQQCHNTSSWTRANFRHQGVTSGCVQCHQTDFAAANSPNHAAAGYPTSCEQCHTTATWAGANFAHQGVASGCVQCHQRDYSTTTSPNHAAQGYRAGCEQCHGTSTWGGAHFAHTGVTSGCVQCHQTDFNGTTAPNHTATGISTNCQNCHSTTTWAGAVFNHRGITSGCVQCHQTDYNGTTSPNHAATGISTNCQNCHGTTTWKGAAFNHRGITNGCLRCHQSDYNGATNPNHLGLGYPTNCEFCHTPTTWNSSSFNHQPYFPIASGHHHGLTCHDCHQVPSNPASFTCISCHEHAPSQTNGHHNRVSGYVYNSTNCYACHPTGQGD